MSHTLILSIFAELAQLCREEMIMTRLTCLLSFLAVISFNVSAATEAEVKAEISYRVQVVQQAEQFVERTINLIATPFITDRDIECLARNIFYESGGEPLEGKVAVGIVTINRTQDPRYPNTICGVVKQKTTFNSTKTETVIETVPGGLLSATKQVAKQQTRTVQRVVCQFSWVCQRNIKIREDDPRWVESKQVAENLANGGYPEYQQKYANAKYFHAVYVNPQWKLKRVTRTGNHIFYE